MTPASHVFRFRDRVRDGERTTFRKSRGAGSGLWNPWRTTSTRRWRWSTRRRPGHTWAGSRHADGCLGPGAGSRREARRVFEEDERTPCSSSCSASCPSRRARHHRLQRSLRQALRIRRRRAASAAGKALTILGGVIFSSISALFWVFGRAALRVPPDPMVVETALSLFSLIASVAQYWYKTLEGGLIGRAAMRTR